MEEDLYIRIEDYLDGTLAPAAREAFEAEIQQHADVAAAVAAVRETREQLRQHWAGESAGAALHDTLQQLGKAHFPAAAQQQTRARRVAMPRHWWAVAAGLALLLVAWLFLRPPAHERLYARYQQIPEASFTLRGDAGTQHLKTAEQAFNRKDYAAALQALQAYLADKPDDPEAQFFSGLCLAGLERWQEAGEVFGQIAGSRNVWAAEARWQQALVLLRQNQIARCKETLGSISPDDAHYRQAQELLGAL